MSKTSQVSDTLSKMDAASMTQLPRFRYLIDAWLWFLGLAAATALGFWMLRVLPDWLDPDWKPVFGPGLPGPRPSTMQLIGFIFLGLIVAELALLVWYRWLRGLALGLACGWLGWAIFCWCWK